MTKTAIGADEESLTLENEFSAIEKEQEPNRALYGLIKELDSFIQLKKSATGPQPDIQGSLGGKPKASPYPIDAIKDLQQLLAIAIEVFQNNQVSISSSPFDKSI